MPERCCRACGCTENNACICNDGLPCAWAEDDLCTACEEDGHVLWVAPRERPGPKR